MSPRFFDLKPITSIHPDYDAFKTALFGGTLNKETAITHVKELTGLQVHDVGNTDWEDLHYSLCTIVNRKLSNLQAHSADSMPLGVAHIVIGHAYGTPGRDWTFLRNKGNVEAYVNKHVPNGETAWVLACSTEHQRNFSALEGQMVTSGAQSRRR